MSNEQTAPVYKGSLAEIVAGDALVHSYAVNGAVRYELTTATTVSADEIEAAGRRFYRDTGFGIGDTGRGYYIEAPLDVAYVAPNDEVVTVLSHMENPPTHYTLDDIHQIALKTMAYMRARGEAV